MLDVPGPDSKRLIEVVGLVEKRVGAVAAAMHFLDITPKQPRTSRSEIVFQRDRGTGRPTKKDRRDLERLRSIAPQTPEGTS